MAALHRISGLVRHREVLLSPFFGEEAGIFQHPVMGLSSAAELHSYEGGKR